MLYDQCKNCYYNLNEESGSVICRFDNKRYLISDLMKDNGHCAAQDQIYMNYNENYFRKRKLLSICPSKN